MKDEANNRSIKLPGLGLPVGLHTIIRLQGYGNYSWLYLTTQSKPLLIALTLKWFEDHLPVLVRVHKSELVNPTFIKTVVHGDDQQWVAILPNGYTAKVSRRRIEQVLAKIRQPSVALAGLRL